jgi:sigma-B regulation protein RsbU (phosphoserine phosphatase)
VPVATRDEFGQIARHTNTKIEGLRHRQQLISAHKLAEEVQLTQLPAGPPKVPGLDLAGTSIYCNETGGDYFDYILLPEGRLGIVVADVSGHGIDAALFMASARPFCSPSPTSSQPFAARTGRQSLRDPGQRPYRPLHEHVLSGNRPGR